MSATKSQNGQRLCEIQELVGEIYDETLQPLADKYLFELPARNAPEKPVVLVLGNHSSGKSAFINHLLGQEVQRTGLAPVDDGFTILTHSEEEQELDGPAVVTHPDHPWGFLERYGPELVSRVVMKTRPIGLLQDVTLIDSPGMIDTAEGSEEERGYDFISVVRRMAEAADVVMLLFDPDKPGTTGETLTCLRESLSGMDHKLLVVMNKVDRFTNMQDFARAYGSLCWNLARTMSGKDVPHIYSTYVPVEGKREGSSSFPLEDFDTSREELIREVHRAPSRRAENMVSEAYKNARSLEAHVKVIRQLTSELLAWRMRYVGLIMATLLLTAGLVYAFSGDPRVATLAGVGGVALAGLVYLVGRIDMRWRKEAAPAELRNLFRKVYKRHITERDAPETEEFEALWERTQERTERSLEVLGMENPRLLFPGKKRLDRLENSIRQDLPSIRSRVPDTR
jgi:GTPase SAR1 family protein